MARTSSLGWVLLMALALSACAANGGGGSPGDGDDRSSDGIDTRDGGAGGRRDGGASNGVADSGNGGTDSGPACKTTCEADECGAVSDGCGSVVQCLDQCPEGQGCGYDVQRPNRCAFPPAVECIPKTAAEVCPGKCGAVSDGCSDVVQCSEQNGGVSCSGNQLCGGYRDNLQPNVCVDQPTCTPQTCASLGLKCGLTGDGCGGQLDCTADAGGCTGGEVCGTGMAANRCVTDTSCSPKTPAVACANTCGQTGDGCGGLIDCEAHEETKCAPGTTCGGGGVAGQCGSASSGGGTGTCTPFNAASVCAGKCGSVSNGCGGAYRCADHGGVLCDGNAGESCGSGGTANVCGKPVCPPKTQAEACPGAGSYKSCGRVPNGCGALIDCGGCLDGQECGLNTANVCGDIPVCQPTPMNVACSGKCGTVPNGCEGTYNCSAANGGVSCSGNEFCGALAPNQCGTPISTCVPKTCAMLGHSCGLSSDGCGKAINCWPGCAQNNTSCQGSCSDAAQACLSDVATGAQSCVTGTGGCTGSLCDDLPSCAPNALTRLSGTVRTPGLTRGGTTYNRIAVPNAVVYIPAQPNAALPAIFQGVQTGNAASCGRCEDEELVVDGQTVLAAAVTDYKGEFTLEGRIPVGVSFNLVVKAGKWRRVVQVPAGVAQPCQRVNLADDYTRLARSSTDGRTGTQLPRVAISTGEVDEMECVFRNIGIDEGEFTVPSGSGRIHMYRSNGARMRGNVCNGQYNCGWLGCNLTPGTRCSNNNNEGCRTGRSGCSWNDASVADSELYGNQGRLNGYDMVVWDCEGEEEQHNTHDPKVEVYVNAGGRMFASHFSYAWIEGNGSLDQSASWRTDGSNNTGTGFVSMPAGGTNARPRANPTKSPLFRNWLDWQGALTGTTPNVLNNPTSPQFAITDPRDRAGASVGRSTDEWVYRESNGPKVQQLSFNTPYGANARNICGRVAYSGFHVASASDNSDEYFPDVCSNGELSAQEKVLVFMLFDLSACVSEGEPPKPPECTPKTAQTLCPGVNDACGQLSDGCGNLVDCGGCGAGFYCDGSSCRPQQCTPATCASLGFNCGAHADGCGGFARDAQGQEGCGDCAGNQLCGLGGPGLCGTASCPPISIDDACGPDSCGLVSDGCGDTLDCGPCDPGQVCGGGGPNVCGNGSCTQIPKAEACLDFNCGLVSDGCGGTYDCGQCTPPDSCGGGGMPNVCGRPACVPFTKDEACMGLQCGWVSDGCGGAIQCGTCPDGSACGGAGPNLCGAACPPTSCDAEDADCGKIGDDCGGILDCGPCPTGQTCGAAGPNKCGGGSCSPTSCGAAMAECGLIGNGCGGVLDCGPCTRAGDTCGGAGLPNRCGSGTGGCNPLTCEAQNVQCGAAGNGCGGLLDCGGCLPGYDCERGACVRVPILE